MFSRLSKQVRYLASNDFFSAVKCLSALKEGDFMEEPEFGSPSFI